MASVFVGNLPLNCTEQELYDLFTPFGLVTNVNILYKQSRGTEFKQSSGYGFVHMTNVGDAYKSIQSLHAQVWNGRNLKVAWASAKTSSSDPHLPNLERNHIGEINEIMIRDVFQIFGTVEDVCIKNTFLNKEGVRSGYCFVHFESTFEGLKACESAADNSRLYVLVREVFYRTTTSRNFEKTKDTFSTTAVVCGSKPHEPANIVDLTDSGSYSKRVSSSNQLLSSKVKESIPPRLKAVQKYKARIGAVAKLSKHEISTDRGLDCGQHHSITHMDSYTGVESLLQFPSSKAIENGSTESNGGMVLDVSYKYHSNSVSSMPPTLFTKRCGHCEAGNRHGYEMVEFESPVSAMEPALLPPIQMSSSASVHPFAPESGAPYYPSQQFYDDQNKDSLPFYWIHQAPMPSVYMPTYAVPMYPPSPMQLLHQYEMPAHGAFHHGPTQHFSAEVSSSSSYPYMSPSYQNGR